MTGAGGVNGARGFVPALEGMRACAAMGVVLTHVAFQTGQTGAGGGVWGRVLGRFDLAVAVFFALSGFLLWRGHAAAARGQRRRPTTAHYVRSRLVRILPGYLVAVVLILLLLPENDAPSPAVWLANLTLTQIYVPLTLTAGLTQMWSLSVEMAFYLVLPALAFAARRLRPGARVPVIAALAVASWAWAVPTPVAAQSWPPAFFSWFAAGMLLAEAAAAPPPWVLRWARRRAVTAAVVVVAFAVAASPLAGPEGLAATSPAQFAVKTAMGAVVAGALLAPLVLDRPGTDHRWLGSPLMVTLGRWSYGLFVWHLAALAMVFPVLGVFPFDGHLPSVFVATLLLGFAMAAVSYALVEEPARRSLRAWERRRGEGSAATATASSAPSAAS